MKMIPVGYMMKRLGRDSAWSAKDKAKQAYSVSNHAAEDFADYINFWKHNGYWFFNTPQIIRDIAKNEKINLLDCKLFYYEVYEEQYFEKEKIWRQFKPEESFITNIETPLMKKLEGYDVVNFYVGASPECSLLCCNSLFNEIAVNEYCLIDDFHTAKALIQEGSFDHAEPGPYRIFAVYSVID